MAGAMARWVLETLEAKATALDIRHAASAEELRVARHSREFAERFRDAVLEQWAAVEQLGRQTALNDDPSTTIGDFVVLLQGCRPAPQVVVATQTYVNNIIFQLSRPQPPIVWDELLEILDQLQRDLRQSVQQLHLAEGAAEDWNEYCQEALDLALRACARLRNRLPNE
jgi:hypothetical protein